MSNWNKKLKFYVIITARRNIMKDKIIYLDDISWIPNPDK